VRDLPGRVQERWQVGLSELSLLTRCCCPQWCDVDVAGEEHHSLRPPPLSVQDASASSNGNLSLPTLVDQYVWLLHMVI
jgi:hypothetical protein